MALAKAVQGARRPSQEIAWTDVDGNAVDLSGATLTGRVLNLFTGQARDVAGTLGITDATAGVFVWAYAAADVAEAGSFDVQFTATFLSNPTPARTFRQAWIVEPSI